MNINADSFNTKMELTADLIAIQGILSSKIKQTGEFTKINYRGGNEDKILDIMTEVHNYLKSKNYIKNQKINTLFHKELGDIVFFLAINTVYKKPLVLDEYAHLINIIPPISKCLFANITYGLDLCEQFAMVIEILPLYVGTELLDEAVQCLKKSVPKVHLEYASIFLTAAAKKLSVTEFSLQVEEDIDDFTQITNIMLSNLTGIYSDQTKNMKQSHIYQHMGYCLMKLFDLLLLCKKEQLSLQKFVSNVIRTCCSIIRNVTINVYCAWAEIDEDGESLQHTVSEKAYQIIASYYKFNEASELISMLGAIAKKPLSITELIQKSDTSTIIKMINKKDANQLVWFKALFTTQVFKNQDALDCISRWAHLCNEDDVTHLLNLSIQTNNDDIRKLIINCAACLDIEPLILVCTRHFYRNKFSYVLNENVGPSLTLLFNKINQQQCAFENLIKEVILLLLQNPTLVFAYCNNECVKNTFYTDCLTDIFDKIKEISQIDYIGITSLKEAIINNISSSQNMATYAYLFKKLEEVGYFTKEDIILKILLPLIKKYNNEECLKDLNNILRIIMDINILIPVKDQYKDFIQTCLQLMKYRCKFLNFDATRQEVIKYLVDIFYDLCEININSEFQGLECSEDYYMNYYKKYLSSDLKSTFFRELCPDFEIENYGSCVSNILQILPPAVSREWLLISEEIIKSYGSKKCIELFTDIMILLSQLVETQNVEENNSVYGALSYCIKNFGMVIQRIQCDSSVDVGIEVMVTRQICRIIAKLPEAIKEQEGLLLLNVLTERSLKILATDKDFLCLIILIKNTKICKALVEQIKTQA